MPSHGLLRKWKEKYPEFVALSARARQESAEAFNDKVLELSEKLKFEASRRLESGKEFPKGTVEALKIVMQEYARQAAIRDDRNYGDRKKITLDATENVGKGMQAVYQGILKDLKEMNEDGKESE